MVLMRCTRRARARPSGIAPERSSVNFRACSSKDVALAGCRYRRGPVARGEGRTRTLGTSRARQSRGINDVIRWRRTLQRPCDATAPVVRALASRHEARLQAAWRRAVFSKGPWIATPGHPRRHERERAGHPSSIVRSAQPSATGLGRRILVPMTRKIPSHHLGSSSSHSWAFVVATANCPTGALGEADDRD